MVDHGTSNGGFDARADPRLWFGAPTPRRSMREIHAMRHIEAAQIDFATHFMGFRMFIEKRFSMLYIAPAPTNSSKASK